MLHRENILLYPAVFFVVYVGGNLSRNVIGSTTSRLKEKKHENDTAEIIFSHDASSKSLCPQFLATSVKFLLPCYCHFILFVFEILDVTQCGLYAVSKCFEWMTV